MKVPPKRKGNSGEASVWGDSGGCLNESPSEKEGKCDQAGFIPGTDAWPQ